MKWLVPTIAAFALAIFSLSVPVSSPVFSTKASAGIMNGKGNCSGGVCTGGGAAWSSQHNRQPKAAKKKPAQ
jgi:hypothetical protein